MDKALIVIDVLNEFVYGDIKGKNPERIIPNLKRLVEAARQNNIPVIYCKDEHLPVDRELKIWGKHAMKGSKEAEIVEELKPEEKDYIIPKRTYSGFFETGLDSLLRDLGAKTLYVTGLYDDPCVRHTVADAYFRRYNIVVVKDSTDAFNSEEHDKELNYMKKMYGVEIKNTDEVIEDFRKSR